MAHIAGANAKRLNRLRCVKGQIKAIEQTVGSRPRLSPRHRKSTPAEALDGLIAKVMDDHIREHLVDPSRPRTTLPCKRRIP